MWIRPIRPINSMKISFRNGGEKKLFLIKRKPSNSSPADQQNVKGSSWGWRATVSLGRNYIPNDRALEILYMSKHKLFYS